MNTLQVGFSRVNITPPLGCSVYGYFIPRIADGVLDDLYVRTLVLACGETKIAVVSIDNGGIPMETLVPMKEAITAATGIPMDALYIHETHTHTGPLVDKDAVNPLADKDTKNLMDLEYVRWLTIKLVDSVQLAINDIKPAKMGYAVGNAPNIAFIRRFRMKDGSVKTNPGVDNPDIVAPIGSVDERVNVLRFDRDGDSIVLVNFGVHPDVVGGSKISADWPGFVCSTLEQALPGVKALFFNGAEGDVNHVNVHPRGGDLNDMFNDFDDVTRGYGHARHMGRVIAGGVLQVFDKVHYVDVDSIRYGVRMVKVPSQMPDPSELPEAHRINDIHEAGQDEQLPYTGMMLTTVVAEAARMVRLENGPEFFEMPISGVAIGDVALVGLPGEPFTGIGRGLKETEGWALILPTCITNAYEGYFPMQDSYDEGGYEARSSNFKAGTAELLINEGKELLQMLSKK